MKDKGFQRVSGCFKCLACSKQTRAVASCQEAASAQLCKKCYVTFTVDNHHSDCCHDGDISDCSECQAMLKEMMQ